MKNKYLTKCLCITVICAMVLSGPIVPYAAQTGSALDSVSEGNNTGDSGQAAGELSAPAQTGETAVSLETDPQEPASDTQTDTPASIETPDTPADPTPGADATPAPEEPVPTDPTPVPEEPVPADPTPVPEEPTPEPAVSPTPAPENPTPTPGEETPSVTPTPGITQTPAVTPSVTVTPTPTATPAPVDEEKAKKLVSRINKLYKTTLTAEDASSVKALRKAYDELTAAEQALVTNYNLLVLMESTMERLGGEAAEEQDGDFEDGSKVDVVNGEPVYLTDMVSNLHAGKEFYLNSLQENYQLSFSEDFAQVMEEIEEEYKAKNKLTDVSDASGGVTTSADSLLVRNWQDILAIYVYEQSLQGVTSYTLDASCKEALAAIFEMMNPVIRDEEDSTKVSYGTRHINYYIKKNNIPKSERTVLKKYMETDCKLLCAVVTAAKGFVRQSVGDDVSEERVNVIAAAYSLVGKVGYFWGGKSTVIGMDPSWGQAQQVTAEGSSSTGSLRSYGLDCSGFVTWAVINGYEDQAMIASVGSGTSDQWLKANVVSEADAQPGDLVFQKGPEAGVDNHVGILCGKTDAGDWIVVHCSSSKNGVTVGEAYSASFRYIRQPSFYPTDEQVAQMKESGQAISSKPAGAVEVSNNLQALIEANLSIYGDMDTVTVDPTGNGEISPSSVSVTNNLQEMVGNSAQGSIFDSIGYADAVEVNSSTAAVSAPSDGASDAEEAVESGFMGIAVTNSLQELLAATIGIQ